MSTICLSEFVIELSFAQMTNLHTLSIDLLKMINDSFSVESVTYNIQSTLHCRLVLTAANCGQESRELFVFKIIYFGKYGELQGVYKLTVQVCSVDCKEY